jgi:peptide/nickel transport system permease protein
MFPVILLVTILNFLLIHAAPGDPAAVLAGDHAPLEYITELRKSYGLDKPLLTQLFVYLGKLVRGDLGFSYAYRRPVLEVVAERLQATLLILLTSQVVAIVVGTLLGALAARYHGSLADTIISGIALLLYSIPVFWMGLMLILIFAVRLGWLPSSGMFSFGPSSQKEWVDVGRHLVLPVVALFLYILPTYVRLARESVLEVAQEDFVTTARAIGYPERVVYVKYALRNALLPVVTVAGLSLSSMFAGALLTETVFGWPGMGRLMYEAVIQRDFPVLMGGFLLTTVMVVVGSFVTDLLYTYLDPRVRYS